MDMKKIRSRDEIKASMMEALKAGNTEAYLAAFDEICDSIAQDVRAEFEQYREEQDSEVLAKRGVRQLTSEEKTYYSKVIDAMRSVDPKAALSNLDVVMPYTIIDSVFEDLRTNHPLLSRIRFMATNGAIQMYVNTNGEQKVIWGELTDAITKELASGFKRMDTALLKLSAYLPVAKSMLDLGPSWLDRYVREVLYEALANGLESGLVDGDGKTAPIGMTRTCDESKTSGGVYPRKAKITVNDFSPQTMGRLTSLLAKNAKGGNRRVGDLILVVNPQDYYEKVMPATTLLTPNGTYSRDVFPVSLDVIESAALSRGEAVFGMANRYQAFAGMAKDGNILFSDDYKFLEDLRVYLIKTYANGQPLDDNAFLFLDIDGLKPAVLTVQQKTAPTASNDAALAALNGLTLTPTFAAATTTYTATTSNASDVITAIPNNIHAEVEVLLGTKQVDNGSAIEWATGSNTLKVNVVAEDGTTKKTYTVTVTKS